MAFAVTNTFTGDTTLSATELDQNFTDIENELNGNLTEASLASSAQIANTQLANNKYEYVVSLRATSAQWVAAVAGDFLDFVALPTTSTSDSVTLKSASWISRDVGAQTGQFRVEYGTYDANGNWVVTNTVIAATTLTANSGAANTAGSAAATLAMTTLTQASSSQKYLALVCATADATANSSAEDQLVISILVAHELRAS